MQPCTIFDPGAEKQHKHYEPVLTPGASPSDTDIVASPKPMKRLPVPEILDPLQDLVNLQAKEIQELKSENERLKSIIKELQKNKKPNPVVKTGEIVLVHHRRNRPKSAIRRKR